MLKKIILGLVLFAFASMILGGATLAWLVVFSPGEEISRENIESILSMESPVYYRDGTSQVGVFFEQAHRQYVTLDRVPRHFIEAIVAAEDSSFFDHRGVDFTGVARAAWANFKARRVVQGGSTITQQTAKNLFERQDRSLAAKIRELIYALRLEYHYDKEDILEFYLNQFYVSGNGRGLGMAARYFFDKPVEELDLQESAFIAGSVKGPNRYNPFTKRSEEAEELARQRAGQRTGYVLNQMRRLNYIDAEQLAAAREREIPFNQGQMAYALNTVLDLVREGLEEPEVAEALSEHGIDNVATSGIRIITTVDRELQDEALYALRKELSRLDIRLRGYDHRAMQEVYAEMSRGGDLRQQPGPFLVGAVTAVEGSEGNPRIRVDLSGSRAQVSELPAAYLDRAGLFNLLQPQVRHQQQAWSDVSDEALARLLEEIKEDDLVYVSVRSRNADDELLLDLEKYPELQGGVLAMQEGHIRAMVGGVDNRHYNRAVTARRPMGSAMKPLLYAAALQLGWNSTDVLENRRDVFVYQGDAYFPRPFQNIRNEQVSLSWAGVTSENLASIWLLYHLVDQLPPARFADLVESMGLARKRNESLADYTRRIRDEMGVRVDRGALQRRAFTRAIDLVEPDLMFAGREDEHQFLRKIHYGVDFERFEEEVEEEFLGPDSSPAQRQEGRARLELLEQNLLRYLELRDNMRKHLEKGLDDSLRSLAAGDPVFADPMETGLYRDNTGNYVYSGGEPQPDWQPVGSWDIMGLLVEDDFDARRFWDGVLIDGRLQASTLDMVEETVEDEYRRLAARPAYDSQVLYQIRDFRVMVALQYMVELSRNLGVESQLDPVLSFPLGSNSISLLELTRIFGAFKSGELQLHEGRVDGGGLSIIKRIEASDGEIIYQSERGSRRLFTPHISLAVSDIMRNAMVHGTGRAAYNRIRLHSTDPVQSGMLEELELKVPLFGKTGTANRYTNAAFAGYLPSPGNADGFAMNPGHTLAAYVGFDDNQPMVHGSTRITGGAGALPVWSRLAGAIYRNGDYVANLDLEGLAFSGANTVPVLYPSLSQVEIPVERGRGGVVSSAGGSGRPGPVGGARIVTFGRVDSDGSFVPERFYEPYWRSRD